MRTKMAVTENQRRSIVSKYEKGEGLVAISAAVKLGVSVVRRVLVENEVPVRGQGRPTTASVAE